MTVIDRDAEKHAYIGAHRLYYRDGAAVYVSNARPGGRHRAGDGWLPTARTSRRFLLISFIDAIGTGLFLAGSAIFFTRTLGLSTTQVGIGLSLSGVAGLLGMVPIGKLADRVGAKGMLIGLHIWRGLGFVAYPFVDGPIMFMIVAFLIGIGEWSVGPIVQTVVGGIEQGGSRVRTMGSMSAVRNVGFTVGALLATAALTVHDPTMYSGLVLADAATFFIAAWLLSRLPIPRVTAKPKDDKAPGVRVHDARYLLLTAFNGVLYLHTIVLSVGLPLWIATRTRASTALVGAVVVLNTVMAIGLQVRLSRGKDDVASSASRQHWAGWCLAACCLLIALTEDMGGIAVIALVLAASAALTLGEIWQAVGAWGISFGLSPEDKRSYYLSVYNLGLTGSTVVGPALVTYGVVGTGAIGWICFAGVFVLSGLTVKAIARRTPALVPAPEPAVT